MAHLLLMLIIQLISSLLEPHINFKQPFHKFNLFVMDGVADLIALYLVHMKQLFIIVTI